MNLKNFHFHFVGIGGIGMCGLAELLHTMGAQVTGSDPSDNAQMQRLQKLGIVIYRNHQASHIGNSEVVVYSSAIPQTNPEIVEAKSRGIPLIPRAEALAEMMRLKRGLAIAGTHGKTTTTCLASSIFLEAQMSPTIVVGGHYEKINSTAVLGQGEWLIAEADESDGSFHKLSPEIAIVTNIDADHLDHFKSFENLEKSFYEFLLRIPFYGACVVCGDDDRVRTLLTGLPKRIFYYGFKDTNDFILKGSAGQYEIFERSASGSRKSLGIMKLQFPGQHFALNALAATVASLQAGIPWTICMQGILKFTGVDRRFQLKGEKKGILVYDDYGHHPTEVKATLQAFREKFPKNKIVVCFQPHRFSRTENCWHDFTQSFGLCDNLYVLDIYAGGESPRPGVDSERLAKEIKHPRVIYMPKSADNGHRIASELKSGDVFVTLGAGDGWKLGLEVLEKLS